MPVGTVRTWASGIRAVKHADGWVVLGGKNHGKLMGNFKEDPTHKEFADQHKEAKPVVTGTLYPKNEKNTKPRLQSLWTIF